MAMVFSKVLTADDIENGLSIPGSSLGQLPDQEGLTMSMQRNDSVGHFLSVGWNKFVRERDLRVDDKVTIHEEAMKKEGSGTWIKVEVKRKIRLFGEDIWADV
uniref:TF-B3 domain-containing protein n=1 Tax=Salix viminalis TaxID=40686 RepID=A0A6N2M8K1_SALVM